MEEPRSLTFTPSGNFKVKKIFFLQITDDYTATSGGRMSLIREVKKKKVKSFVDEKKKGKQSKIIINQRPSTNSPKTLNILIVMKGH